MGLFKLSNVLYLALSASSLASAIDIPKRDAYPTCTSLNQRKSWSALTTEEKAAYIEAELCLMSQPPSLGIEGALNRWDELQYSHIVQSNIMHDVGAFLPWHRLYMRAHEILLQTECGYTGSQPYWDELSDVVNTNDTLEDCSVLDADTGFGSGDVDGDGCIVDGPFVNLTMHINQTSTNASYCLSRSLSNTNFNTANSTYVDACMETESYDTAWLCFKAKPHTAGHSSIGGTMLDAVGSPGDPLFFLHHTYLDRIWWQWQEKNSSRLTQMTGRNIPLETFLDQNNLDYPGTEFTDYFGDNGNVTTLNHTLWMVGLVPNATVGDVMDIRGDTICAEYVD